MSRLFCSEAYLRPLRDSGCVSPQTGWTPVSADFLCYEKSHSWGEFVFDQAFARAYAQRGMAYYPKLVSCIPFTPVPGPRLPDARAAQHMMSLTVARGCSGAHALFVEETEAALLQREGWLRREQPRYVWLNQDYAGVEDFLAALNSKRRKNIRSERRALAASGLQIEWQAGHSLSTDEWRQVFPLYASTYELRGQQPYLKRACLQQWAANFGEQMQFCLARDAQGLAAMAFYFVDGDTLYGRHWGSRLGLPGLHFELCCYQGIEYAIRHGLRRFDAGVQGEHKLLRGFSPELSLSMHWFAHEGFREAIAKYLEREREAVSGDMAALGEHDGYRHGNEVA